jgi:hypothetical protein
VKLHVNTLNIMWTFFVATQCVSNLVHGQIFLKILTIFYFHTILDFKLSFLVASNLMFWYI